MLLTDKGLEDVIEDIRNAGVSIDLYPADNGKVFAIIAGKKTPEMDNMHGFLLGVRDYICGDSSIVGRTR